MELVGIFGTLFFFLYRKEYKIAAMLFAFIVISCFIPFLDGHDSAVGIAASVTSAAMAEYFVCYRFIALLDKQDDETLRRGGGVNRWAIWLAAVFYGVLVVWLVPLYVRAISL